MKRILLIAVVLMVQLGFGQTNTWDGSSDANWNTAANWSLNLVPTAAHDVVINTNAAILVDANSTINSLVISNNVTVSFTSNGGGRTITIDNNGSSIGAGSSLTLQGSTGTGTRSMTITYTVINSTMNIAGTLVLTNVGDGTIYNAANSITTVTGTIRNNDSSTGTAGVISNSSTTNLVFASGGNYSHELNGGAIPTASWNVNSDCTITGMTDTEPTGITGQTFGNLTWNCAGQTVDMAAPNAGLAIAGNLAIQNSNGYYFRFGNPGNNIIGGNFVITGGNVRIGANSARAVDVAGNFSMSGGNLEMTSGNSNGTLNISGNFSHTAGTITESGNGLGAVVFNKSGTQTFTSGGTVTNTINFTVNSGATLQMATPTTVVSGSSFILSAGASLGITSTLGITLSGANGNIQTTTRTFTTGANYIYNGSAAQVTGNGLTQNTPANVTISNTAGVTFSAATTISGNLSIVTAVKANLSTFTHTANRLTLGGGIASVGSWGSTSSTATNKNDTYFAATTGLVNVSASTCTAYTSSINSSDSACNTVTPGSVNLKVKMTGGTGPFTVVYRNEITNAIATVTNYISDTNIVISPLPTQTTPYTLVSVTDASGCLATLVNAYTSVLFYSIPATPTAIVVDVACPNDATGSITITNAYSPASLKFNGVNINSGSTTPIDSHVDFGTTLLSNRAQFTAEGWIKFNQGIYQNRMSLFGQNDVLEFGFQGSNLECWTAGGGVVTYPLTSYPSDSAWHHIAVIANGINLIFYIDGVQVAAGGTPTTNYGSSAFTTKIGWGVMDAGGVGLVGEVFNLGFWSRALSVDELKGLASGFTQYNSKQVGLLAGYSFNEGTGTTVASVGNPAPVGTLKGTTLPV